MDLSVGTIVEGKVTGITKFGAFVALPEGKSGMVHISEITNAYVTDIHDFLQEGDTVTAKIIQIDEKGRIALSIKKANPPVPEHKAPASYSRPRRSYTGGTPEAETAAPDKPVDQAFEDKLKQFMQISESKMSDLKGHLEKRGGRGRR